MQQGTTDFMSLIEETTTDQRQFPLRYRVERARDTGQVLSAPYLIIEDQDSAVLVTEDEVKDLSLYEAMVVVDNAGQLTPVPYDLIPDVYTDEEEA